MLPSVCLRLLSLLFVLRLALALPINGHCIGKLEAWSESSGGSQRSATPVLMEDRVLHKRITKRLLDLGQINSVVIANNTFNSHSCFTVTNLARVLLGDHIFEIELRPLVFGVRGRNGARSDLLWGIKEDAAFLGNLHDGNVHLNVDIQNIRMAAVFEPYRKFRVAGGKWPFDPPQIWPLYPIVTTAAWVASNCSFKSVSC